MSQMGMVALVENDENGNEVWLAGIIGRFMGLTSSAMESIESFYNFAQNENIEDYEDHVLYGIRMMLAAGANIYEDELDELYDLYPEEDFDDCSGCYDVGQIVWGDCTDSEYSRFEEDAAAKFNLTTKTISFHTYRLENYDSLEEVEDEYDGECDELKLSKDDMDNMSIEDFETFKNFYFEKDYAGPFYINGNYSKVYCPIDM